MNRLYYGDCLTVMQEHMKARSVDLIYLDPPFNSNREYNAIYKDDTGRPLPDQIEAFCDLWTLDEERERVIRNVAVLMRESGVDDSVAEFWKTWLNALRYTQPRLLAYLSYMVQRLLQMKTILKATGSIYLHCDATASHYIKAMMDGIYGHRNFRDEIVWQRAAGRAKGSQHESRTFGRDVDYILHYSKTDNYVHNEALTPLTDEDMADKFPHVDEQGRRYNTDVPIFRQPSMGERPNLCYEYNGVVNPHPSGWRVSRERLAEMDANGDIIWREGKRPLRKSYAADYRGKPMGCLWTDIPNVTSSAKRMGYQTEKPLALLDRIIQASSNEEDVVFDPFCGCGTTLESAQRLNRKWVGIDIAIHAVKRVTKIRLVDRCGLAENEDFEVLGVPRDLEGARDLWENDKHHFQKWAVEQVDGFVTTKKTADGGVDGRLYFGIPNDPELKSMAIEVKGGVNVGITVLRALAGVVNNDMALMGGLLYMEPLGERKEANFRRFMAEAGDVDILGVPYPKLQMLSVAEILDGKRFKTPGVVGKGKGAQQTKMVLD